MRQAAHGHHLTHGKGETQAGALRQYRQASRPRLSWPTGQGLPVQADAALARRHFAAQGRQQRALAGAIGAEYPEHGARLHLQIDALQHQGVATAHAEIVRPQHQARPRTSR